MASNSLTVHSIEARPVVLQQRVALVLVLPDLESALSAHFRGISPKIDRGVAREIDRDVAPLANPP